MVRNRPTLAVWAWVEDLARTPRGSLRSVAEDLIAMKDAVGLLNVSRQRVKQLVAEGKLTVVKDRSDQPRILFRRTDVERLRLERGVGRYGRT